MLNLSAQNPIRIAPNAEGHYSVIAFLVDFQVDKDTLSFGNGKFNLTARDTGFAGSFPHDEVYFSKHLEFLKNYWEGVSKGKMSLSTYLIPIKITLPHVMEYYSTYKQSSDTVYAKFISDFITAANNQIPNLNSEISTHYISQERTHFVVFHAGLGHDIDWSSIYSYDPTPKDISSLFLSEEFIKKNLITIPNLAGNIKLQNLSILPETLTRPYEAFGTKSYLNFGISGLMVANFGNFLGLPDLYNTQNGHSTTGRFGLMDGYGFFNYNGFIPSPPSVWEKYQLGWVKPIVLDYNSPQSQITIKSDVESSDFDSSAVFIYLGSNRYYLLENRLRENPSNKKGVTVSYFDNNSSVSKYYSEDRDGFYQYDLSEIKGVITGLTNYNWVVPAGINSSNDTIQGGILIWRLDDQVVSDKKISGKLNELNSNAKKPALRIMEADGSVDIGEVYGSLSGASGSETGTIFDYWYRGNIAPIFKNAFSSTSRPSSDWDYKIPTGLKLSTFSRPAERMTVQFEFDNSNGSIVSERKVKSYSKTVLDAQYISQGSFSYQLVFVPDSVFIYSDFQLLGSFPYVGKDDHGFRNYSIDNTSYSDKIQIVYKLEFNKFQLISLSNGVITDLRTMTLSSPSEFGYLAADLQTIKGNTDGKNYFTRIYYKLNDQNKIGFQILSVDDLAVLKTDEIQFSEKPDILLTTSFMDFNSVIDTKLISVDKKNQKIYIHDSSEPIAIPFDGNQVFIMDEFSSKKLILFNMNDVSEYNMTGKSLKRIASIKSDSLNVYFESGSENYIFSAIGNQVYGYESGKMLSSFPLEFLNKVDDLRVIRTQEFGYCLLIKSNGFWFRKSIFDDKKPEFLSVVLSNTIINNNVSNTLTSASVSNANTVEFVQLKGSGIWNSSLSSASFAFGRGGMSDSTKQQFTTFNFPGKELAYSWPNPATDDVVHFRLNLPFSGSGTITVLDLTGQKIKTLSIQFEKNQEVESDWILGQAQSGLYFATVDVSGNGKSFSKIIKVVVAK